MEDHRKTLLQNQIEIDHNEDLRKKENLMNKWRRKTKPIIHTNTLIFMHLRLPQEEKIVVFF